MKKSVLVARLKRFPLWYYFDPHDTLDRKKPDRRLNSLSEEDNYCPAGRYIAIAARRLDRCGIGILTPSDTEEADAFVIMKSKTSHTSRVPVPIVFPFSSRSE